MDFEFKRDILGRPIAKFSMGHEPFGRWLSEELTCDVTKVNILLNSINAIESGHKGFVDLVGSELQLSLSINQVTVEILEQELDFHNISIEYSEDQLYEAESNAECGLQDFKQALNSWLEFISG